MADEKNKKGFAIMICNIVIMIANYLINMFSQSSDKVAMAISKIVGAA